jgi:hypothetical protein
MIRDNAFGDKDMANGRKLVTQAVLMPEGLVIAFSDGALVFQQNPMAPVMLPGPATALRYYPELAILSVAFFRN